VEKNRVQGRKHSKKRIGEFVKEERHWFILQLDTNIIYDERVKRYFFYCRGPYQQIGLYPQISFHNSTTAADFFYRLYSLPIANFLMENGNEFAHHFRETATQLGMNRYFSRVKS
jgi:hypothetical protein